MAHITLSISNVDSITTDVLVVPLLKGAKDAPASPVGLSSLEESFTAVKARGAKGALTTIPAPAAYRAHAIVGVGLGAEALEDVTCEDIRYAFGSASRTLTGHTSIALAFPAASAAHIAAALEGAALGAYAYGEYKSDLKDDQKPVEEIVLAVADKKELKALEGAANRAEKIAEGVHLVRDLVNTPPNLLYPESFEAPRDDRGPR